MLQWDTGAIVCRVLLVQVRDNRDGPKLADRVEASLEIGRSSSLEATKCRGLWGSTDTE